MNINHKINKPYINNYSALFLILSSRDPHRLARRRGSLIYRLGSEFGFT